MTMNVTYVNSYFSNFMIIFIHMYIFLLKISSPPFCAVLFSSIPITWFISTIP